MSSELKGNIRGAHKTHLGTALNTTKGSALKATNDQYKAGITHDFDGYIYEVLQRDMGDGKEFFPYVKVELISPTGQGTVRWPYWLRLVDPPKDMGEEGGLKGISLSKPRVKIKFLSNTRKRGVVTLNAPGSEIDDYSDGEIAEYEGFDMV
jgi:hypothetical protein